MTYIVMVHRSHGEFPHKRCPLVLGECLKLAVGVEANHSMALTIPLECAWPSRTPRVRVSRFVRPVSVVLKQAMGSPGRRRYSSAKSQYLDFQLRNRMIGASACARVSQD